jgi:integrase
MSAGNGSVRRSYGTGSLYVRKDSRGRETYYGRFYAGSRQVKRSLGLRRIEGQKTGLTRAQAERALQRLIETHATAKAAAERIDIAEAAARYLLHLETVMRRKPSTLQDYEIIARRHLVPFFGGRSLDRIDTQLVSDYLVAKRREGLASNSIKNQMTFLHGIFRHAMKKGWARANPVAAVDRPREDAVDPDIRFLDREEVEALLRATPESPLGAIEHAIYLVAAQCGLRQGELLALRWRDVDWSAGVLRVRRNYTRGTWGTPKSRRSSRAVPMTSRVMGELDRVFKRSQFTADDDLVFAHPRIGSVLDASKLRKRFAKAVKRAGLRPVRFHDLRHTFGTQAAAAGVPLRTLQEWMGHRDYKTTSIYADYAPRADEQAMIERAFAPAVLPDASTLERDRGHQG